MKKRSILIWLSIFLVAGGCFANRISRLQITEANSKECFAGDDKNKKYFLINAGNDIDVPGYGFGLVVVLPGETGGADLLDFVKELYKNSLDKKFIVAQLVAVRWDRKQRIIWPTETNKVEGQLFSTEEFIEAVIEDVRDKYKINNQRIFTLCWDCAGRAGYMASVRKDTPITGNLIVMSDFQIDWLGDIKNVNGKAYYILHSVADDICPVEMPQLAYKLIADNGGIVNMETYKGGHGWQGNSLKTIKLGMRWLKKNHTSVKSIQSDPVKQAEPEEAEKILRIVPLSGIGDIRFRMNKNKIINEFGQPQRINDNKLFYLSHGLQLSLSPKDESLMAIACGATNETDKDMIRLCDCKTSKGIGMGSSREDVVKAYGKSSSEVPVQENVTMMFYDNIKAQFVVTDNKVTYMIFKKP
jgi:predicted esterase